MKPAPRKVRFTRAVLFGIAALAPLCAAALWRSPLAIALAPIFFSHLFLLYATLAPNCQWWGPVVRSFETSAREVWITIDDGPSPAHTLRMLDLLAEKGARATFFVIGKSAEKYPHLITEILARGHHIANHTFTHPFLSFWIAGPRQIGAEVDLCAATLRSTPDRPAQFFRAPAGLKNPFVHHELQRRGLRLIGWSIRSLDTLRRDAEAIARRIAKRARPGAIILLHEGHRTETDVDFHPRVLELTLAALSEAGFAYVIPRADQLRSRAVGK